MADISDWWVVEYSPTQRAFNVQTVAQALADNAKLLYGEKPWDPFVILAICETREEAGETCARHTDWRDAQLRRAAAE